MLSIGLWRWYINITITILDCLSLKQNVSETGFLLRLQVKPTQLGSIDRGSLCLSPRPELIYCCVAVPSKEPPNTCGTTAGVCLCTSCGVAAVFRVPCSVCLHLLHSLVTAFCTTNRGNLNHLSLGSAFPNAQLWPQQHLILFLLKQHVLLSQFVAVIPTRPTASVV
jgi:hypothetical protein